MLPVLTLRPSESHPPVRRMETIRYTWRVHASNVVKLANDPRKRSGGKPLIFESPYCYFSEQCAMEQTPSTRALLLTKRPGRNAFLNCIIVFKLSSNSKSQQIFASLNSNHSTCMAKQEFARLRIKSRHDNVDFYLDVDRRTATGYDKDAAQPDVSAVAHRRMPDPVVPVKNDREDQPKTNASPSLDPKTLPCVCGSLGHNY